MGRQINNFGRFYLAIRAMNPIGDRDEVKRSLVWQYTNGRTDSLREMTREEYDLSLIHIYPAYGISERTFYNIMNATAGLKSPVVASDMPSLFDLPDEPTPNGTAK